MELKQAHKLARDLMREHKVYGWGFKFDNAVRRFGACHYDTKTLTISHKLTVLNPEAEVRNVILHEIAHALAGPGAGHGHTWKRVARSIGCTGARTHDAVTPEPPYQGTCPKCGKVIKRARRVRIACLACCQRHNSGKFSPEYLFSWVDTRILTR